MAHTLPELPYSKDALAPVISAETLEYHYGKHHQGYVNKLNGQIEGSPVAELGLEDLITKIHKTGEHKELFNNAAQIWNHTFYWNCMKPGGGGEPSGKAAELINKSFGDFSSFKDQFSKAAASQFGSGWAWLVNKGGKAEIITTGNADVPWDGGPNNVLLTLDVWEHAYYIDYRNARPSYIDAFWKVVNWDWVSGRL